MNRYAIAIGVSLAVVTTLQSAMHAEEMKMMFPPAEIGPNERLLSALEIGGLSCTAMARETIEDLVKRAGPGCKVDMSGETVSHHDEFGYIYRYRMTQIITENGKNYSHDLIDVLWSKDCKSMGIATFPTLELNLPRTSKGF